MIIIEISALLKRLHTGEMSVTNIFFYFTDNYVCIIMHFKNKTRNAEQSAKEQVMKGHEAQD